MHIDIRDVSHNYQTNQGLLPVIKNLSISIKKGGFTAIVGPSGCGKSTITRLVSGLLKPTKGSIFISNEKVLSPISTVGMAFQNPVLLEWRNVINNIILPLEIVSKNLSYNFRRERALELLKLVGLEEFELNLPSELSGGMKQRVSLCRSLVHKPEVLILDEPFAALDAFTREDLWNVMHKLKSEQDFTCILITHDLREAVYLADQVIVLSGRPATLQCTVKSDFKKNKTISDLYSLKVTKLLATLRQQIEIAQSKNE
tara:strand:+ start:207 stop:980 length:774 start_codon:yes stop_codon:yes gene_type:complete